MKTAVKYFFVICMALSIFTVYVFAGNGPNYNCEKMASECEKNCDRDAEMSKNARAYQNCLDRCSESSRRCSERQEMANGCAESFRECIKNAGSESAKESCRSSYRNCKGHD